MVYRLPFIFIEGIYESLDSMRYAAPIEMESMEAIWLENYPEGVPHEYELPGESTLLAYIQEAAKKYGPTRALSCMGQDLTFTETDQYSDALASYFQRELGLKKGDRIALMLPNVLQYPIALFAAIKAGLVIVNVNPLYTARELEFLLEDSEADAIIVLANFAHVVEEAQRKRPLKHVIVTEIADMHPAPMRWIIHGVVRYIKRLVPSYHLPQAVGFREILKKAQGRKPEILPVEQDDLAVLQYTGGTTGFPKGAMLSHRNLCSNIEVLALWFKDVIHDGREIAITALPLYHIFSFTANLLLFYARGGLNVLIPNPRDIPGTIKELKRWKFSYITGVNTLFNALLHHPQFDSIDFSGLRLSVGGGMAVQKSVADEWQRRTGNFISQGYGLTETSPVISVVPAYVTEFDGSIGPPLPSTKVQICDLEGNEVPLGEPGELWVKGPQVTKGYWKRPKESKEAFADGGWFRTGDMARMDERGFIYIVDRKKDMILVSGFNVYPNEVEDVVVQHEKVLEAAAIGVKDEERGEVVKLFVVKKDPSLTKEELVEHCRANLARYKVPRVIEFREELPKTPVGKILRRELRDEEGS